MKDQNEAEAAKEAQRKEKLRAEEAEKLVSRQASI